MKSYIARHDPIIIVHKVYMVRNSHNRNFIITDKSRLELKRRRYYNHVNIKNCLVQFRKFI